MLVDVHLDWYTHKQLDNILIYTSVGVNIKPVGVDAHHNLYFFTRARHAKGGGTLVKLELWTTAKMVGVECTMNGKTVARSEVLSIVTLNSGNSIHAVDDWVTIFPPFSRRTICKYSG